MLVLLPPVPASLQVQKPETPGPDKGNELLALTIPGTEVLHALSYGTSLWGETAKVPVLLGRNTAEQGDITAGAEERDAKTEDSHDSVWEKEGDEAPL
jgi:hypothetical protein